MPERTVVKPGAEEIELRLRVAAPVTGIVTRKGAGAPGVELSLRREQRSVATAVTDATGWFKLPVAAEEKGLLTLVILEPGRPELRKELVRAGTSTS